MAKVKKIFTDRKSKKVYRPGVDYTGSDERIAELAEGGFVVAPKAKKKKEPEEEPQTEPETNDAEE